LTCLAVQKMLPALISRGDTAGCGRLSAKASFASERRAIPARLTPLVAFAYASPSATETPCQRPAGYSPTTADPPVAPPAASSRRSRKAAPARAGRPGYPPE